MAGNVVEEVDNWVRIQHALVSVSDKHHLEILVPGLISINRSVKIFSTGGTFEQIQKILGTQDAQKHLVQVSDYTGQPETQGGLVKTLDFKIYLGLLTETYNDSHQRDLSRTQAVPIDLVVVNLYPFQQTIAKPEVTVEQARADIDIGGPCMVRAAAKNFLRVTSVTNPTDYQGLIKQMRVNGGRIDLKTRFAFAKKAFAHTAEYDSAISGFLAQQEDAKMFSCYRTKEGQ